MRKLVYLVLVLVLAVGLALPMAMKTPALAYSDSVTLNPTGNGDPWDMASSPGSSQWEAVKSPFDGDDSYLKSPAANFDNVNVCQMSDVDALDPIRSYDINSVTVYIVARAENDTITQTGARFEIKTYSSVYDGNEVTLTASYLDAENNVIEYSQSWVKNPSTNDWWTWEEVDALEAGVSLRKSGQMPGGQGGGGPVESRCTQVWVVVEYEVPEEYYFGYWRPPISLDSPPHEWNAGSTKPVKFIVVDGLGNEVKDGVEATVKIGESDGAEAVWEDEEDYYWEGQWWTGQWKANILVVGPEGLQYVTIDGNVLEVPEKTVYVKVTP